MRKINNRHQTLSCNKVRSVEMWNGRGVGSGCGNARCSFVLLSLIIFTVAIVVSPTKASEGSPKDITFARPKHLRYPSYKSQQKNESSLEEAESRRHAIKQNRAGETLDSEESKIHTSSVDSNGKSKGGKYSNVTTEASAATNLKRSLLPGHGGGDIFGDSKTARFGPLGIQKTPPDLQFGLAFTVPFVSLSTDKLINTFSGKSYGGGPNHQDVSSILKLNLGGLIAAVIVGIGAFFLVPGLLHPGKLGALGGLGGGGWGGSLLDSILPQGLLPGFLDNFLGGGHHSHYNDGDTGWSTGPEDNIGNRPFGYQDFYEYNGVHNHNRKDTLATLREKGRRDGRSNSKTNGTDPASQVIGNIFSSVTKFAKKYVATAQSCIQLQICRKAVTSKSKSKKEGKEGKASEDEEIDLLGLVESLSENELVAGSPLSQEIKKAHEYGQSHGECQKYEKPECK